MVALMQDRDGLATLLKFGPYAQAALVPATPWLDAAVPSAPRLAREGAQVRIDSSTAPARWAVWRRVGGSWRFAVQAAAERMIAPQGADRIVVSAVGAGGRTSERITITLP
jgi:hypothetical protein